MDGPTINQSLGQHLVRPLVIALANGSLQVRVRLARSQLYIIRSFRNAEDLKRILFLSTTSPVVDVL